MKPALMALAPSRGPRVLGLSRSGLHSSCPCLPPSPPPLLCSPLQVKIFEEDFQRERSDRERMNEEKEELKKQVEKLQAQVTLSNAQVRTAGPGKGQLACSHGVGVVDGPWGNGKSRHSLVLLPALLSNCCVLSTSLPLPDL